MDGEPQLTDEIGDALQALDVGQDVEIYMGYQGTLEPMMLGEITSPMAGVRVAMINTARVWSPLREAFDPTEEAIVAEMAVVQAAGNDVSRGRFGAYQSEHVCPACRGARLRTEALAACPSMTPLI